MLFAQIATGGRGYGVWTPALVGLTAAVLGFCIVLVARGGYHQVSAQAGA
jgi:hypothetical protein